MILVIVESPGKISKIESILGAGYKVIASVGHVIELDKTKMSIEISNKFEPIYINKADRKDVINKIKKAYSECAEIYIATDEDREGEMIAWSIAEILKIKNAKRISFNSITKEEIIKAINNPRKIDLPLVEAQKARRTLDRLVGYELSPLLWKSLRANLSAGRVQSVVTKIIIDKEEEIEKYYKSDMKATYKMIGTFMDDDNKEFTAQLHKRNEEKELSEETDEEVETKGSGKAKIKTEEEVIKLIDKMKKAKYKIINQKARESIRNPSSPFTTSTLQQEALHKLGFAIKRTMQTAQNLYEAGHITYMRTDSVSLSNECQKKIKEYVIGKFTKDYYRKMEYKSKTANTQESHEAVRPSHIDVEELEKENKIQDDEIRLYRLIWKRTVSSQMSPAKFNNITIEIDISNIKSYIYKTEIETLKYDGYLRVYNMNRKNEENEIIKLSKDELKIYKVRGEQEYTKPKVRYNEATLVKKMDPENLNIGRPSTYSTIINTIIDRNYVEKKDIDGIEKESQIITWEQNKEIEKVNKKVVIGKEQNKLVPTLTGRLVNKFLVKNFPLIMDYGFTSKMEENLDLIAEKKETYENLLNKFYSDFHPIVEKIKEEAPNVIEENSRIVGVHPETNANIVSLVGKYGPMLKMSITKSKFIYAPIKEPLKIETITLEDALKILEYPKIIGKYNKKQVKINKGKYGLYIEYDKQKISVTEEITIEKAIELIEEKKKDILWESEDDKFKYIIKEGPYGKYISIKSKGKMGKVIFVKLPENTNISEMSIDKVKEIRKKKPKRRFIKKS